MIALPVTTLIAIIAVVFLFTSEAYPSAALSSLASTAFGGSTGFASDIYTGPLHFDDNLTGLLRANIGIVTGFLLNPSAMGSVGSTELLVTPSSYAILADAGWLSLYPWMSHDRLCALLVTLSSIFTTFVLQSSFI